MIHRADQLPDPPAQSKPFGPIAVGDTKETATVYELWGATKLTVQCVANPVFVQLSRSTAGEPQEWDAPIPIPVGPWGHAGPFGYWRFYNQVPGHAGNVSGAAYRE